MNCEFQFLYENAGRVEAALVVARDRAAAVDLFKTARGDQSFAKGFGAAGARPTGDPAFVRFVPNGLPGDGLDLQQFADYLGDSVRTARRMLSKVSHVRCGSRVSITVPALEEFERRYTLKSGSRETRKQNGRCRSLARPLLRAA